MTKPINTTDPKVAARFETYSGARGPDDCWNWQGPTVRSGHGQIWNGQRNVAAHRYALAKTGTDIAGKLVCHRCNNPACVNPAHLYAGTYADNMRDCVQVGTHKPNPAPKGEGNYCARLTENDVRFIRENYRPYQPGRSARSLARQFGLSASAVTKVLRGETWTHV